MELADFNKIAPVQRTADTKAPVLNGYSSLELSSRVTNYPINNVRKSVHSTENKSRLFSPYGSPSAINVENKALAQSSSGPIYQHNIAITKYHHVSVTPKPRTTKSMNILA